MKKIITNISVLSFLILSCCSSGGDDNDIFQGSERDLTEFFSDEVVQTLNELQFTVNQGSNPPNLEGMFFASPLILSATNVPSDAVGTRFIDFRFEFSNQDNATNTINFNAESLLVNIVIESFFGDGSSFISGSNDSFSVFSVIEAEVSSSEEFVDLAYILSGNTSEEGVLNLEFAIVMLDNRGNPSGLLIENGQGRSFVDEDGLSERLIENTDLGENGVVLRQELRSILSVNN